MEEQEQERKRIARELHDSTVQNLTTLIHKTELCSKLILKDPIQAQLEMRMMSETLRSCINEMRDIIYNLRPMMLDDLGIEVALEQYIAQVMVQNEIKIELKVKGKEPQLLPVVRTTLFRVITEACNNAILHAGAKKIGIELKFEKKRIFARVEDDGIGFEINNEEVLTKHFGISIMRERIHLLQGELEVSSELKKGTIVSIKVPITEETLFL